MARGVTQLKTGKWQARVTESGMRRSLGLFSTEAAAAHAIACHAAHANSGMAHANPMPLLLPVPVTHVSSEGSTLTPAPEPTASPAAGTTERQAGSLAALLKRHLSADTMARLKTIQTELQVDSLEAVLDYLVSDNCWAYA